MTNQIERLFFKKQLEEGLALAASSDVLDLQPLPDTTGIAKRFIAEYSALTLLRGDDGVIRPAEAKCVLGISFRDDHLRYIDPLQVVTWLAPSNIALPNVMPPFVCVGRVFPGWSLVDCLFTCHEIICGLNWASDDALNSEAAEWVRNHQHLLPVDRRPLRRRLQPLDAGNQGDET